MWVNFVHGNSWDFFIYSAVNIQAVHNFLWGRKDSLTWMKLFSLISWKQVAFWLCCFREFQNNQFTWLPYGLFQGLSVYILWVIRVFMLDQDNLEYFWTVFTVQAIYKPIKMQTNWNTTLYRKLAGNPALTCCPPVTRSLGMWVTDVSLPVCSAQVTYSALKLLLSSLTSMMSACSLVITHICVFH
jgi:hypothetical protein